MGFAKISQVAHYAPDHIVTNDDLSQILETSDEWIASRTGIKQRHISQCEQTSDLATRVAESLLKKAVLSASELDFIIVATITPDSNMPSVAAKVQGNIKAQNAFAFDVTAACSGFVFALATAEKFIASGQYRKGLIIGAEVMSKVLDWTDRSTAVLFGDGAGGVLLEAADAQHFLAESLNTKGEQWQCLQSGNKGLLSSYSQVIDQESYYLQMDGRAVFDFTIKTVSASIRQLLDVNKDLEIDYFLLHQANIRILDKMAKKVSVNRDKFLANMQDYGNTSGASIPILLSESVERGLIQLDGTQTIFLSAFGGGLTWGNLIVKI
ncbi:beta-ketoacyl-ACP synthase III [Streptococcus pluranimalium]|uniref:beta-ketoacyl-ACP synthase III n=1 Tax=Streptococcus pluranimalium TaxID=82348 RepID=UPI002A778B17|nr:beta-ketoacyl-ACP synthase III [Streptococcus pluranimalium]